MFIMLRPIFLFVTIGCISAAILRNTSRIVGGEDAGFGEFPYVVSLRIATHHVCGGSILNKDYVLTAAHCRRAFVPLDAYSIQYGAVEISDTKNVVNITSIKPHPQYDPRRYYHDIMVVKVASSFPLDGHDVTAVVLPLQNAATPEEKDAVIVGWGSTVVAGETQVKLQALDVVIYTDDKCKKYAHTTVTICAGAAEGEKGVCTGDSGGPLTIQGRQYGVFSSLLPPCGDTKHPSFYTKVSSYISWIKANTNL